MLKSLPLAPQNVILIGNRAFEEVIKVEGGFRVGPNQEIRKRHRGDTRDAFARMKSHVRTQGKKSHLQTKERRLKRPTLPTPLSWTFSP